MTESDLLAHLFERLARAGAGAEIIGAMEARQWPDGAIDALIKAGVLRPAQPAQVIECDGCEKNCFKPVHVRMRPDRKGAMAFITCDEPEDVGRIPAELGKLEQWQATGESLAGAVARLLSFTTGPQADAAGKRWALGLLEGKENKGAVALSVESGGTLTLAEQSIPLAQVMTLDAHGLKANKDALLRALDGDAREPAAGVGSTAWRKRQAKAAADARHGKPGGSRDVQEKLHAIWASGKYTSRDRCAEEECGALGISYSTARKALRNTPEPQRT